MARFEVSKLEFNSISHIPAWVARSDNNVAAVHFWPGVVFLIFHFPFPIPISIEAKLTFYSGSGFQPAKRSGRNLILIFLQNKS